MLKPIWKLSCGDLGGTKFVEIDQIDEYNPAQLIVDYFDELDKTAKRPYNACLRKMKFLKPNSSSRWGVVWKGLVYCGVMIIGTEVQGYDKWIESWIRICNLEEPDAFQQIQFYIDRFKS